MDSLSSRLSDRIREYRVKANLTQTQLAELIEESTNTISRWETGFYLPRVPDLEKLAHALKVKLSDLLPEDKK